MKHWIKKLLYIFALCGIIYFWGIVVLGYLIDNGYTNSLSEMIGIDTWTSIEIPVSNQQIHTYISQHREDKQAIYTAYGYINGTGLNSTWWFPSDVANNIGFKFIIDGITTRKVFLTTIKKESEKLWIDYTLVLSSLLWEQIRIASKWLRGELKDILIHSTPTLLRSYNISLGIWGIKLSTARQIAKEAKLYGYGDVFWNYTDETLTTMLTTSDYWQGIYPTYLVKNIITRWQLSWYDISHNPGVVGTLYNMGNPNDKPPHDTPEIGWSVIPIGKHKYVYWWISLWLYRYLKIYASTF